MSCGSDESAWTASQPRALLQTRLPPLQPAASLPWDAVFLPSTHIPAGLGEGFTASWLPLLPQRMGLPGHSRTLSAPTLNRCPHLLLPLLPTLPPAHSSPAACPAPYASRTLGCVQHVETRYFPPEASNLMGVGMPKISHKHADFIT